MDKFEKLRDMESFSDDMFNRIFGFQQKLHPAWNTTLSFDQRIQDLPLHYLVFSNPDRDPKQFGSTVAPYYPLRGEMRTLAHYIKQVAQNPVVCDLHPGNGFTGSLLAREGVKVIGVRDAQAKPNQIKDFYDGACYEMREARIEQIGFAFDVALSSWMPAGENFTPQILRYTPKLIIFIHTDHVDETTHIPQTGTPEAFRDLPARYQLIAEWSITRPQDMFHEIWPDLSQNIEETRRVKIYADAPFHHLAAPGDELGGEKYPWENELDMILLALEAKTHLRAMGHQL
ncbi:MAG: hypothetical protein C4528_04945 [Gammaproteobacteria bacterium]|nr:MAG: hypothetical protein C4528_04945 [Gammaproteobacteria bacterium]